MKKYKIIVCIILLVLAIALTWLIWRVEIVVPTPPPYSQGVGAGYAKRLAEQTQKLSLLLVIVGWISVTSGSLFAVAGAVLGSRPLTENNRSVKAVLASQRGLICIALAVVLGGFGWQCIDRSTSATKTSSVATTALATATIDNNGEKDKAAYTACVEAKSAWLEGRMSHERLQNIVNTLKN